MNKKVVRFAPQNKLDFYKIHSVQNEADWCYCSAWWTPTWEGWGDRSAVENLTLREALLSKGNFDGYLLYVDEVAVGWCQVGRRDRLEKLIKQFESAPENDTWAITCFLIAPNFRRQGLAEFLLVEVLKDLPSRGGRRVEVFPRRGQDLEDLDMWNGPEAMFLKAGFHLVKDDPVRPILAMDLFSSE